MPTYTLTRSPLAAKKFRVTTPNGKKIDFGAKGYQDYTSHRDDKRKASYVARHRPQENWTRSGINTAGFWSLWLLWNKPTIDLSKKDIEKRFGIKISTTIR